MKTPIKTKDKTVLKALSLSAMLSGGCEGMVDVKDGRIVRVRPFKYDWKVDKDKIPNWKITKNGKTLERTLKSIPGPWTLAYKKRVYSPNRIKYPLKRVDWDPDGDRNPQNRGKSKYKRISWDEAADLIAREIRRIHKEYGVYGILMQGDGHGECHTLHAVHGQSGNLLDILGGFTQQARNPDSWEGWYWGAKHVWGNGEVGLYSPNANVHKDTSEHTEMILFWGCDPETTPWGFAGQTGSLLCYFWKEIGIKQVYICPDLNYGAAIHADKWIPVYPNTDAALQLAIIYMWITEGTYDKGYVDTHVVGFDKFSAYVLGEEDGIPKSPEWASKKCGVPEWTIKALAREFARLTTSIAHFMGGGFIRSAFSHEQARLEVCLLAMQGLGGPGVHQIQISGAGLPQYKGTFMFDPEMSERILVPPTSTMAVWQKQLIPKTLIHKAIESDEPISFYGTTGISARTEDQFTKYTYPLPKEEGGTQIHMMWTDTPCRTTCWNAGNKTETALRNPKIECIVSQHPWMENDCYFSDIILPVNTYMEVEDIINNSENGTMVHNIIFAEKAIEPIGESKSNFEAVLEVAKKMGKENEMTGGITDEEMMQEFYEIVSTDTEMSFDEFKKQKYFLKDLVDNWEEEPPGFRLFYEDPEKHRLATPSGKLEFYSERLAKNFPDDQERPPIPKWIEKSAMHNERRWSDRAKIFPLILMSNHGRWRMHSQCDDISWTREIPTCKVTGPDGYKYEPMWINTKDAEERGIKNGDIVKVMNELGTVLCGAYVTERLRTGVVYCDHGARVDFIKVGEIDRGGAINTISPDAVISKNCAGMATSSYLVQVERLSMDEYDQWRKDYPESFEKDYDPGAGLQFSAWIEKGEK